MKRLLTILFIVASIGLFAQTGEIKPITCKALQTPNNATFYFNPPDTTLRVSMGAYGILEIAGAKRYQRKLKITTTGTSGPSTLINGVLNIPQYLGGGGLVMVYPDAGIPTSTGTAWGASIPNNSGNWNTAYGWGNHAGLYAPLSGSTNYVQVSPSSAQEGNVWMNGSVSFSGNLSMGSLALMNSTYKSGLHQDVGGELLEFGTNVSQLGVGNFNSSHAGALFRIDTRPGLEAQLFSVIYQSTPGSTDTPIFQVGTGGNITAFGNIYAGADIGAKVNALGTSHGIFGKAGSVGSWGGIFLSNDGTKEVDLGNDSYAIVATGNVKLNSLASTNTELLSHSPDGTLTSIPNGTENQVLKIVSGVPVFADEAGGGIDESGMTANFIQKWDGTKFVDWINPRPQTIPASTTAVWDVNGGIDANMTMTGDAYITLQNLKVSTSGTLHIYKQSTNYRLKFKGYTLSISRNIDWDSTGILITGDNKEDSYTWTYNGDVVTINGNKDYNRTSF